MISNSTRRMIALLAGLACTLGLAGGVAHVANAQVSTVPGMPPVIDPHNIFSETARGKVSPEVGQDLARVYV